jgi:LacI family transcriptional regulator
VATLLDERRVTFDALLGANDYMALYATRELQRRGIAVPEAVAVAVAGFDDVPDARNVASLTTVRQPFDALAEVAVRLVLERVAGAPPRDVSLPALPVFRRS